MAVKNIVYDFEKEIIKDDQTININFNDDQETITLKANSYEIVKNVLQDGKNIKLNWDKKNVSINNTLSNLVATDITKLFTIKKSADYLLITAPSDLNENIIFKVVLIHHAYNFSFDVTRNMINNSDHKNQLSHLIHDFGESSNYFYNCCLFPLKNNTFQIGLETSATQYDQKWTQIQLSPSWIKIYCYGLI